MITESLRQHILAVATGLARDADEAEDVTQVVLLKLHRHFDTFRGDCALSTWLFRVTRNVAVGLRRRDARRSSLLAGATDEVCLPVALPIGDTVVARRLDHVFHQSMRRLQPRQREVFELTLDGVGIADIARHLGVTRATVRASLCKARRTLQAGLERDLPALWAERASATRTPRTAPGETAAARADLLRPASTDRLDAQDAA